MSIPPNPFEAGIIRPITTKLTEKERSALEADDALLFDPVEYDDAIVGVLERNGKHRAAYNYDRLCEITIASNGGDVKSEDSWTDAADFVSYNMVRGAMYMGDCAPIVLEELNEDTWTETGDEEDVEVLAVANKKWVAL